MLGAVTPRRFETCGARPKIAAQGEQDRSDVLALIDDWQDTGLTIQEIEDDSGLSDRTIRGVLEELLSDPPRIGVREEQAGKHGRRAKNYFSLRKKQ